ncbi:methyltransferase domain-containing protein [uncultured Jatrophihabitans sp.]|uniref:methyltransferase domain-containing protein n=1 Tax=uncultured Jatrophihabitans sp. TaxID=1610747 RepID=UPI0035CB526C
MQTDTERVRPALGRLALVSRLLEEALAEPVAAGRQPTVLDCGGGSGAVTVPLARAGADVTVVDVSADALATLRRRAAEAGVSSQVRPLQGDAENLAAVVGNATFDLVLAHGILEAVDDVAAVFAGCAAAVRAGGLLSVVVSNPPAAVLARALGGEPAAALDELHRLADPGRLGPDVVTRLCQDAGMQIDARHGIGTFSDLVPGAALDGPGARDALAQLDLEAAGRSPFAEIAGRIHVLARRAG